MTQKLHVMLDIETAGTTPGSAILQIAAIPFNIEGTVEEIAPFNFYISLDSCKAAGLTTDEKTLAWWAKQEEELRTAVFGSSAKIKEVLEAFYLWYKALPETPFVWGNGANFDTVLLEAAFRVCGVPVPWGYYSVRCYRTITKCFPLPQPLSQVNGKKHDALSDATYQAQHLIETSNYIDGVSDGLLRIL